MLPAQARQVVWGALWAVGTSVGLMLVLAVILAIVRQFVGAEASSDPVGQIPGDFKQPVAPGGAGVEGVLAGIGALFTLLPIALGNLWLLANGLPVGLQNVPDLSQVPLFGQGLADATLRVSLAGSWPLILRAGGWRSS